MTSPGREALLEAMRLEQARIYGQLCPEYRAGSSTSVHNAGDDTPTARVIRLPRRGAA